MPKVKLSGSLLMGVLLMVSCAKPEKVVEPQLEAVEEEKKQKEEAPAGHVDKPVDIWFKGSPALAFANAKRQEKLVFLYWGAVWCPPCNQLKAEVFSKPKFRQLMEKFFPVYLDGDTETAQIWGEKLAISGYPTVLILTPDGQELYRLNTSLSEAEFIAAVEPLLDKRKNFAAAFSRLEEGKAQTDDWNLLAYTSWEQLPDRLYEPARISKVAKRAAIECPKDLFKAKALLAANLLTLAGLEKDSEAKSAPPLLSKVEAERMLDIIFANELTVRAARSFISNYAVQTMRYLYPDTKSQAYLMQRKRWIKAANSIGNADDSNAESRLAAANPSIELYRFEKPKAAFPPAFVAAIQKLVAKTEKEAKTPHERQSLISTGAYLLRQVGDYDGARALLIAEVARTESPWYYYSSLSALEEELKNDKAAQLWASKAREAAQGRASKVQWITSDILLNTRIKSPEQKVYLLNLSKEYYKVSSELQDGFVGRNWLRAAKIKDALGPWRKDPQFRQVFANYQKLCNQQEAESEKNCQKHFNELLQ